MLVGFAMHRYTGVHPTPASVIYAWQLLGNSVYHDNPYGDRPILLSRPGLYYEQDVSFL
jgi:hypothetical protein